MTMVTCPKCNASLADGSKFCEECGASIPAPMPTMPNPDAAAPAMSLATRMLSPAISFSRRVHTMCRATS